MCGILAIFGCKDPEAAAQLSAQMAHRGPDERGSLVLEGGKTILVHERLSINDLHTGRQPIPGREAYVIHNGEIYNHAQLRETLLSNRNFRTTSDSEVIVHLYEELGERFVHLLDGVFAFVVTDGKKFMAARDPLGVKPLYYGKDASGGTYFASEMKALSPVCTTLKVFPPGHYYTPETGFVKYFSPEWEGPEAATRPADLSALRAGLEKAVEKRLMADVPIGVFLSGGLDSSLVAAIMARKMKLRGQELHSFSIGIGGESPDLKAAREVADFLGTTHHEIHFSVEEGKSLVRDLIWHLESYDVTTLRASTPMYLLSKYIAEQGIKVVLSGEGSDEMFGGYLYFHLAPSAKEFQEETISRVQHLYTADLLRADKSTMAHGLEARVPFLDLEFLDLVMKMNPESKMPSREKGIIEKHILRAAFDTPGDPYLPEHILWRQKEQFSDGVGYSWVDTLIAYAEEVVSEAEFSQVALRYPHNTPPTKEAVLSRRTFEELFAHPEACHTVQRWVPRWQESKDPSGRASKVHDQFDGQIARQQLPGKISA